jgi:hypothetical protein
MVSVAFPWRFRGLGARTASAEGFTGHDVDWTALVLLFKGAFARAWKSRSSSVASARLRMRFPPQSLERPLPSL